MTKAEWQRLLAQELDLVWLEDVDRLDYVRTWVGVQSSSRIRLPDLGVRLVGYTVLKADAPRQSNGYFLRRIFWLSDRDRDQDPQGPYALGMPSEGVDPRTVLVGEPGRLTHRAWYGIEGPVEEPDPFYPTDWWTDSFYEDEVLKTVPSS